VKSKIKNQKFENEVILKVFKLPEVGEKKMLAFAYLIFNE
jgi:hypothetical protein